MEGHEQYGRNGWQAELMTIPVDACASADSTVVGRRIGDFIVGRFPLAAGMDLNEDTAILESGIVDSLGILDIVMYLETEFAITVEDDDITPANFETILRLAKFVESKRPVR